MRRIGLALVSLAVFLVAWKLVTVVGNYPDFILPPPESVIERGLARVEAGAQGEHKLARGYQPTPTYSAHYIPNAGFRRAVADYLEQERAMIARNIADLDELGPFRKG